MWHGPNHRSCTCIALGCNKSYFERDGETHVGRIFHRTNYPRHLAAGNAIGVSQSPSNQPPSIDPPVSQSALADNAPSQPPETRSSPMQIHSQSQKRGRDDFESEPASAFGSSELRPRKMPRGLNETSDAQPLVIFPSESFGIPRTLLQNISCIQSMFHVIDDYINHHRSNKACRTMLTMERFKLETSLKATNPQTSRVWLEIPLTIEKALRCFRLEVPIRELLCCPFCFTMHGKPYEEPLQKTCTHLRFSSNASGKPRITCDYPLYKHLKVTSNKKRKFRPFRVFHHQSFTEWLATMLSFPTFEKPLDSSITATPRADGRKTDIWDGSMWKTFKAEGKVFTRTSGNLVFGFFCDWFNPYGKKCVRRVSAGILLMICFNLPPDIRYLTQNMFLYGIIPGPREPTSEQMSPCLTPLLKELKTLWSGVFFTKTSLYPKGRSIRVAVWPLIADIPAMKKVSGFSSHSSTNFCSICYITKDDINEINHEIFKLRNPRAHKAEVQRWLDAPTSKARQEQLKEDGVRYTCFSELPYWHPIDFPTIDIMHCLILGLLNDLSNTYLQIGEAGKVLQGEQDARIMNGDYSDLSHFAKSSNNQEQQLSTNTSPSDHSDTYTRSSDRPHYPRAAKSKASSSSYKDSVGPSSDDSDGTVQGEDGPALTPHELSIIHNCITTTNIPSWLTRVPNQIGMPRCGTPKAAEWLTLFTIYMVLSLIPYLHRSEDGSASAHIHKAICLATQIINIAISRAINEDDIQTLSRLLFNYRAHLRAVWPNIRSKPNLHYAQHIPDQIRRFGPPQYTAAWFGERTIGTLVQTPKNTNQYVVGQTMIRRHTLKTSFTNLCNNTPADYAKKIGVDKLIKTTNPKWKPTTIGPKILDALRPVLNELGLIDCTEFEKTSTWRHAGKSYSTQECHVGNSRVEFKDRGNTCFGELIHILRIESEADPIFIIQPFSALALGDESKSPFYSHPHLQARTMYRATRPLCGVLLKDLFGHCALVENSAGTSKIFQPTIYVLSLRSLGIVDMASTYADMSIDNQTPSGSNHM